MERLTIDKQVHALEKRILKEVRTAAQASSLVDQLNAFVRAAGCMNTITALEELAAESDGS